MDPRDGRRPPRAPGRRPAPAPTQSSQFRPGRRPGPTARRTGRLPPGVYRRRRLTVLGVAVAVVVLVAVFATGGGSGRKKPAGAATASNPKPAGPPHLVVSMASWQLPDPLSRTVALPVDGSIDVFGGLTGTGSTTTADISRIDPASGQDQKVGTLPAAVHDAAGAVLGSRYLVFGGGAADVTSLVQAYSPDTPAGQPATSVVGHLPARRADLASATAPDGRVYLAGGYDGAKALANVIETRDGKSFSVVGQLPVPVRYAAMAVAAGKVWVMGGDAGAGGDTTAIQTIDLQTHKVVVAGHLPVALAHASAADLGGTVYLFGGRSGDNALDGVWRLDTATASLTQVGTIPVPTSDMSAAVMGETVYLVGGEGQLGQPGRDVVVARLVSGSPAPAAGAAGPPFEGKLLIADRGNNRLLLVDAQKKILWMFPSPTRPAPAQGFYFPDDAFFAKHGTAIITNEEDQDTILELAFPSGQVIASYGHPNVPGRAPGYLNQPDDAYLLKDGTVTVADAKNCRILFLNANFTYASEIGHTGRCHHDIPNDVAYPNGDTPLADGNFLVSEIFGSYVDEVTRTGNVVWSVKLPIAYPSDPQQIGPDLYLIADYSHPGGIFEFTREGKIVWSYQVPSGEGMLDHPSLAERLPNGDICVNDDYRHRVVIIDPADKQIVWQYGLTDTPGSAPGQLKIPDGFDLLAPDGTTPTHPQTG